MFYKPQNWEDFKHGMYFLVSMDGNMETDNSFIGRISIENGRIYLCQNFMRLTREDECAEKFNYRHGSYLSPLGEGVIPEYCHWNREALMVSDELIPFHLGIEDGTSFIMETHNGHFVKGVITVEKNVLGSMSYFLCQNELTGDICQDKKGFRYSYVIKTSVVNIIERPAVFPEVRWVAVVNKASRKSRIEKLYAQ